MKTGYLFLFACFFGFIVALQPVFSQTCDVFGYIYISPPPNVTPVPGVKLTATPIMGSTFTTEAYSQADGSYAVQDIPVGWNGYITPTKDNYVFNPTSYAYSIIASGSLGPENYHAHAKILIHGTVTDPGSAPISPCDIFASTGESTYTSSSGEYYLLVVPQYIDWGSGFRWTGTVTPVRTGYTFTPPSLSYSAIYTDQTGQDYVGTSSMTGVHEDGGIPSAFALHANYPNPFNPETSIVYDLPQSGHVVLAVYDLQGKEVVRLVNGMEDAGRHTVSWDGRDHQGGLISSGVYVYRIQTGELSESRKLVLSR